MSRRSPLPLTLAVALAACAPEPEPDAGPRFVPLAYQEARHTEGHHLHVGAPGADGGHIGCRDCHALDRDGFTSPGEGPCRKCHLEASSFHHGPRDGGAQSDGGTVTCLACHPFGAGREADPPTPWVCLECHARATGRVAAVESHHAACFFCHQPHRQPFTRTTACTVCHPVVPTHGDTGRTGAERCLGCHPPHAPAAEASRRCVTCHQNPSVVKHPVSTAALSPGHPSCGACHDGHRASSPPKPCQTCHREPRSDHPPPEDAPQRKCVMCHPPHQANAPAKACVDCHDAPELAGVVHAVDPRDGGGPLGCPACHRPHTFLRGIGRTSCEQCHADIVGAAPAMRKAGHGKCGDCHRGLPHKPTLRGCDACHPTPALSALHRVPEHQRCETCHRPHLFLPPRPVEDGGRGWERDGGFAVRWTPVSNGQE